MRKRKMLVFSNLQNSVTRMLQQRKKVIFSPLENRKNKKGKTEYGNSTTEHKLPEKMGYSAWQNSTPDMGTAGKQK